MDNGIRARVQQAARGLAPGYFALVMATGIISIGLRLKGILLPSTVMLYVCAVAFVVLAVLTVVRLVAYRAELRDDFLDPRRGFGFFTLVAGCNVLGARLAMEQHTGWTTALAVIALLLWVVLGYVVPWTAVLGRSARPVLSSANGTWFIWVVASQSVAVSAATLQPHAATWQRGPLAILAVFSWSVGIFLYAASGVFVSLRLMLYELKPTDLESPYWVSMGAAAITVLAGARIVEMASAPMVNATRGLVAGTSVVFWSFATWLIPPLVAAGWWRHRTHRVPLTYNATLWSMVFPLGMYAVAGIYLGQADRLPVVGTIGFAELWVALAVWVIVAVAMTVHLWRTVVVSDARQRLR
ncbi:Tellurite resistance protein TehA [Pedococcus cremeus]|uniref:Tellurite resistance protein TehA n=1 Tax=Pedococcus cremeus TaxID=587636 RepID=A0A1H9XV43_9MICO|nr:tellurite resistance/C4-dicarboxylate transporter family protein [Pedococcus cremeus]SES50040.1 Tellurite resistance protein TehA [Pedococcus cremeus]